MVTTLTCSVVAQAVQTVSTANASSVNYNLAPGANSAVVTPTANVPILVMGVQTAVGFRGVAQVTLLRITGQFLEWTGLDSTAGAAITQGFSAAPGTKIVFLDFSHCVAIRVNNADSFRINNACGVQATGSVKMIW
jgi:hypothetical protein